MVICQVSCPLYKTCKDKREWKQCIYNYDVKKTDISQE